LEPKNQKVTYGRYFTEENYKKVTNRRYITEENFKKDGQRPEDPNTPRAPSGPERIEAGTARVPLRAGWERMLCKGEVPFRRRYLSLMLQVFYGIGRKGKMITFESNQI